MIIILGAGYTKKKTYYFESSVTGGIPPSPTFLALDGFLGPLVDVPSNLDQFWAVEHILVHFWTTSSSISGPLLIHFFWSTSGPLGHHRRSYEASQL